MADGKTKEYKIIFHDTETTGIEPEDRILQSAYAFGTLKEIPGKIPELEIIYFREEFINPPLPCKPEAAAVHGIWKKDYENSPSWRESASREDLEKFSKEDVLYVAHNAFFDLAMLRKEGIGWNPEYVIDTLNVSMHAFEGKELKKNALQYMRYFFDYDSDPEFRDFVKENFGIEKLQAHTALSDIAVLAYLFKHILKIAGDIERIKEMSRKPYLIKTVEFGNVFEKGTSLSEALVSSYQQYGKIKQGLDYFSWAITNMETMSFETKLAIAHETILHIKSGKINVRCESVKPMLAIAAAFLPEHFDFLRSIGYGDVVGEKVRYKALKSAENDPYMVEKLNYYIHFATKE